MNINYLEPLELEELSSFVKKLGMLFTQATQPIHRIVTRVTKVSSSVKEVSDDGSNWSVIFVQK